MQFPVAGLAPPLLAELPLAPLAADWPSSAALAEAASVAAIFYDGLAMLLLLFLLVLALCSSVS